MSAVKVIWKGVNSSSDMGYVRLSTRIGKKTKLKNLTIPAIRRAHFSFTNRRVLASCPNYQEYNSIIEHKLDEARRKGGNLDLINDDNKSLIMFIDLVVSRTTNPGTKLKYKNIRNLLMKFNDEKYGDSDVKFSQITIGFIAEYQNWLRVDQRNTINTTSYKIKTLKSLITKGVREGQYNYYTDPFSEFKIKIKSKQVQILDKKSLLKLINTPLEEVYRGKQKFGEIITNPKILNDKRYKHSLSLDDYRNFFIMQVYSMGIRVSDLLTLRYNNFRLEHGSLRLVKTMLKTQNEISIKVNTQMFDILYRYIPNTEEHLNDSIADKYRTIETLKSEPINDSTKVFIQINRDSNLWDYLNNEDIEPAINPETDEQEGFLISMEEVNRLISDIDNDVLNTENISIFKSDNHGIDEVVKQKYLTNEDSNNNTNLVLLSSMVETEFKKELEDYNKMFTQTVTEKNQLISEALISLSIDNDYKNQFCFPLLDNSDFSDINEDNDFGAMTDLQYKRFCGARVYYNRLLKPIAQQCDITINLTTHIARHSYTSLMLELGEQVNLFDLMISLGHQHITTTQKYIQRFTNDKVDSLNDKLSNFI